MVPSLLCIFVAHIIFLHVFFLPPFPSLSLSLSSLFLSVVARHVSSDALYQVSSSYIINLTFSHHILP